MAPAWTSSGGSEVQGEQIAGSGGVLTSRPPAKTHPSINQGPDDARIWRITQGGRGGGTEEQREQGQANPSGYNRDLEAVQGKKRR